MRAVIDPEVKPSDETFVAVWTNGSLEGWTVQKVASRLNLRPMDAYHHARKLAASGVKLPLLCGQTQRPAGQIRKLNAIISKTLKGKGEKS